MRLFGPTKLWQITTPYMCAGIIVDYDTKLIIHAAPILRWPEWKKLSRVINWCKRNNYRCEKVDG